VKNAKKNLDLTIKNRVENVIGIGLGGAEAEGPAREYKKVFSKAAKSDLRIVAHAGEDVGPESVWDALKLLKAARIGHGISAVQDEALMDYLAETQVPLEICPTSNLFTQRYVKALEDHPIRTFFDRGINVTVNTDDPTVFGIDLIDEYMRLANNGFFSPKEIFQLVKNGIFATFRTPEENDAHWSEVERIVRSEDPKLLD
jgi:adenosine deaminase